MKPAIILIAYLLLVSHKPITYPNWFMDKDADFNYYYTAEDSSARRFYQAFFLVGIDSVRSFFGDGYSERFDIYLHPSRQSLDSTWAFDWKMPGFKSECWMVASGVAGRLDALSPRDWVSQACEHDYRDKDKTQQLFTHELVHVYHAQHHPSPDFSGATGIDWFVEGLATFASGQCDAARIASVKKAIRNQSIPAHLDQFWTGQMRYGLSGSVVMYIDHAYSRTLLRSLLSCQSLDEIFQKLGCKEEQLLLKWKAYIDSL